MAYYGTDNDDDLDDEAIPGFTHPALTPDSSGKGKARDEQPITPLHYLIALSLVTLAARIIVAPDQHETLWEGYRWRCGTQPTRRYAEQKAKLALYIAIPESIRLTNL